MYQFKCPQCNYLRKNQKDRCLRCGWKPMSKQELIDQERKQANKQPTNKKTKHKKIHIFHSFLFFVLFLFFIGSYISDTYWICHTNSPFGAFTTYRVPYTLKRVVHTNFYTISVCLALLGCCIAGMLAFLVSERRRTLTLVCSSLIGIISFGVLELCIPTYIGPFFTTYSSYDMFGFLWVIAVILSIFYMLKNAFCFVWRKVSKKKLTRVESSNRDAHNIASLQYYPESMVQNYPESMNRDINTPKKNPGLACFFSFLVVGLGQMYLGQIAKGIVMFICSGALGIMSQGIITAIITAIICRIVAMIDAYNIGKKIQRGVLVKKWECF